MCSERTIYRVLYNDSLGSLGPCSPDIEEANGNGWDCCDHRCSAQRGKASILLCIRKSSRAIRRLDTDTEILLFTFYTHIIKTITVLEQRGKNHR